LQNLETSIWKGHLQLPRELDPALSCECSWIDPASHTSQVPTCCVSPADGAEFGPLLPLWKAESGDEALLDLQESRVLRS